MAENMAHNDTLPLLSVRNLFCAYTGRSHGLFGKKEIKPVLEGINLDILPGEIFGLAGESGCGKTTLARCVLGLVPCDGEIRFNGGERRDLRLQPQIPSQMQMVFQDPAASLNPVKKVGWLLEEPLVIHRRTLGDSAGERKRKADEMLFRVGLDPSYRNRRPDELSGGQKQRLCIGRALILEPKLLIADEAVSSLDVSAGAQILNLFRELHESRDLSILFISHNIGAVEYLCGRMALMRDGKIVSCADFSGPDTP